MNKLFVRKRFLSTHPAQMKFLLLLLVSMLVPVFFVGSFLYLLIFKMLADQQVTIESVSANLYPVIMKTNLGIALGFIPLFLLLLTWGLILSHRFAGPLERLQREIDEMAKQGNFSARLSVRKYDYVKPLVDSINNLLNKISK